MVSISTLRYEVGFVCFVVHLQGCALLAISNRTLSNPASAPRLARKPLFDFTEQGIPFSTLYYRRILTKSANAFVNPLLP